MLYMNSKEHQGCLRKSGACIHLFRVEDRDTVESSEVELSISRSVMRGAVEFVVRGTVQGGEHLYLFGNGVEVDQAVIGRHPQYPTIIRIDRMNACCGKPLAMAEGAYRPRFPVPLEHS